MPVDPRAGEPAQARDLVNIPRLVTAYFAERPQRPVVFGTSGHRGSPLEGAFNEWHILAITQAICEYRRQNGVGGPLYLGFDTHALSEAAFASALEVLAANEVEVRIAPGGEYTPTPAISHAILAHNRGRQANPADGIVITPSHNPPEDGGFKYNPPHGGPAGSDVTRAIEDEANRLLEAGAGGIRRTPFERALRADTSHPYDYVDSYVRDLANALDMEAIRSAGVKLGVDPLGGASVHYWEPVADRYGLNLSVVNQGVDPTFRFMTLDWDGKIRMDPSSPYAMRGLIGLKDQFDVAFACDTDADRHGIVTRSAGLMQPNHFLAVAVHYLFSHRPQWSRSAAVGKTVVSSSMIDRVAADLGRNLYEVPVGFKFFVEGLAAGWLGFGGEESAGASFLRRDGAVWTTDKDGLLACLLASRPSLSVVQTAPSRRRKEAPALSSPPKPSQPAASPSTKNLKPTGTSYRLRPRSAATRSIMLLLTTVFPTAADRLHCGRCENR